MSLIPEKFPLHVACAWIGNSQAIAAKHYLQVTDDHFEKAIASATTGKKKATQNLTQQVQEKDRKTSQDKIPEKKNPANRGAFQGTAANCENPNSCLIPPGGVEPPLTD